jgi:hypothetical protein
VQYSRANPSPRYRELLEFYRQMHVEGERGRPPEETFSGVSLGPHVGRVKRLVAKTGATSILDYGSGKGRLYDLQNVKLPDGTLLPSIADFWDVDYVLCYDPAYGPFSEAPKQKFDGVVCTDVLEHCPEEDIGWIIEDLFGYATRFVFATVACYPAEKHLPNGENAHVTIRPPQWWVQPFTATAANYPGVEWEVWAGVCEQDGEGRAHYSGVRAGSPL